MWAYTNMADPRMKFTRKYLTLRQDASNSTPQKIGMFNKNTWAAYLLNGEAFVKRTTADANKTYPDFGCSLRPSPITNSSKLRPWDRLPRSNLADTWSWSNTGPSSRT